MTNVDLWWLTLLAGLVVLAVAVTLLHVLLLSVSQIDRELRALWEEAGRAAANTSATRLLEDTRRAVGELEVEVGRHMERAVR